MNTYNYNYVLYEVVAVRTKKRSSHFRTLSSLFSY